MSSIPQDKLEKLKQLLEVANDGLSRQEFLDSIKTIINQVLGIEVKALEKINNAISELKANQEGLNLAQKRDLNDLIEKVDEYTIRSIKQQEKALKLIEDKLARIKEGSDGEPGKPGQDGAPGRDADETKIVAEVLAKLPKEKELEVKDIKGLEKELEDLRNIKTRVRGGGTSAAGIKFAMGRIVKSETPIGDINSSNKEFSVTQDIHAILAVVLNGEYIVSSNYTISGRKIVFSEAIPSDYLGKDWKIVYI